MSIPKYINQFLSPVKKNVLNLTLPANTNKLKKEEKIAYRAALKKHQERERNKKYLSCVSIKRHVLVPLGECGGAIAQQIKDDNSRKKNWRANRPADRTGLDFHDCGKYSKRCNYTHWEYTALVECHGWLRRINGCKSRAFLFRFNGKNKLVKAPFGYYWNTDENGLKIVANHSKQIDYHPNADDLFAGTRHLLTCVNEERRKRQNLQKELSLIAPSWLQVTFWDSRLAGNCAEGTKHFCTRHNLDWTKSYRAKDILTIEPENDRVKLAVAAANRHAQALTRAGAEIIWPKPAKISKA